MNDFATDALLSPSKALAQQAQAKDWAAVESWLAKRYASKRVLPAFERNEDTLQALLTLATLNDSADEQRSLVDRVDKVALQSLTKRCTTFSDDGVLKAVLEEMEGCEALTALAETAVTLNVGCAHADAAVDMASAMTDLTAQKFEAEQQTHRVEAQLQALQSEQQKVAQLLAELKSDAFKPSSDLAVEQTSEWMRTSKHLKAKVGEYDERLSAVRGAQQRPGVRIEDVVVKVKDLSTQQEQLQGLNTELQVFQSLPANAKAARTKLEKAREELRSLTRQRDDLFEHLMDDG